MGLQNSALDQQSPLDICRVFIRLIGEGNKMLSSGKVGDAAAVFSMVELEMNDFIGRQLVLLHGDAGNE